MSEKDELNQERVIQFASDISSIKTSLQNIEKVITMQADNHAALADRVTSLNTDYKVEKAKIYTVVGLVSFITGVVGSKIVSIVDILR